MCEELSTPSAAFTALALLTPGCLNGLSAGGALVEAALRSRDKALGNAFCPEKGPSPLPGTSIDCVEA